MSRPDSGFDFWGVNLNPGKVVKCHIEGALLHVTSICLGETVANKRERTVVTVSVDDNAPVVIASLREGVCEQVTPDLVFKENETFRFKCSGSTRVSLVGYVQPLDAESSDDDSDDEDFDCEAEESESEEIEDVDEEVKLELANQAIAGKKRSAEAMADESDEEDESDGDEESEEEDDTEEDKAPLPKKQKVTKQAEPAKETPKQKKSEPKTTPKAKKPEPKTTPKQQPKEKKAETPKQEFRKLPGNLMVKDETIGHGREAKRGDKCFMFYTGRLKTGKIFDSNKNSNKPFSFKLGAGQVIKGWDFGVVGMKVGGKRKIICPPKMAYGKEGAGSSIPPNSVLVFDVELARVK